MAAFTDAAARFGSAGTSSNGTADEAAQRLLPSPGGDVEMSAVAADAFGGGGAARRRATVLKRLESLDPAIRGKIDNQQLVRCSGTDVFQHMACHCSNRLCAVHVCVANRSTSVTVDLLSSYAWSKCLAIRYRSMLQSPATRCICGAAH